MDQNFNNNDLNNLNTANNEMGNNQPLNNNGYEQPQQINPNIVQQPVSQMNNQSMNSGFQQQYELQPAPQEPVDTVYSASSNNQEPKKSKLGLIIVIVLIVVAIIIACVFLLGNGNNQNNELTNNSSDTQINDNDNKTNNTSNETVSLENTYKVPLKNIYVDTPGYHGISDGYTQLYIDGEIKYFVVVYDSSRNITNVEEVFKNNFNGFKSDMTGYHHINQLGNYNGEVIVINGITMYRVVGKINAGENPVYDAYLVGYSFILDNTPCSIFGVVKEEKQTTEQINLVSKTVDAMAKTVRTER